jgi:hypothetical protein
MNNPDYKIEECFDIRNMRAYFVVYGGLRGTPYLITDREGKIIEYNTLEQAKDGVRMLRKYKNRVFHYVED